MESVALGSHYASRARCATAPGHPGPGPRPDPAHTTSVQAALAGVVVLAALAGVVADPVASDWGIAVRARADVVEGGSTGGSAGRRRFRSGRFVC